MAKMPGSPDDTRATRPARRRRGPRPASARSASAPIASARRAGRAGAGPRRRRRRARSRRPRRPTAPRARRPACGARAPPGPRPTTCTRPGPPGRGRPTATAAVAVGPRRFATTSRAPGPAASRAAASATLGVPTAPSTVGARVGDVDDGQQRGGEGHDRAAAGRERPAASTARDGAGRGRSMVATTAGVGDPSPAPPGRAPAPRRAPRPPRPARRRRWRPASSRRRRRRPSERPAAAAAGPAAGRVAPGHEHRVVGHEPHAAVGQVGGHGRPTPAPASRAGLGRPSARSAAAKVATSRAPGRAGRQAGVEHVEPAAADEDPVGRGQVGQGLGGGARDHLDHARRARRRWPPPRPRPPGRARRRPPAGPGAASAASMPTLPLPAPTSHSTPRAGQVEPAQHDRPHLGLGDHPPAVGEVVDRPPAGADRRGDGVAVGGVARAPWASTTTDRWSNVPGRQGGHVGAAAPPSRPGSPSRVATATMSGWAPRATSAAPTASGGAAGPQSTAATAAPRDLGGGPGRAAGVARGDDGAVPRQAQAGERQRHRRRRRVHDQALGARAGRRAPGRSRGTRGRPTRARTPVPRWAATASRAARPAPTVSVSAPRGRAGRRPPRAGRGRRPRASPRRARRGRQSPTGRPPSRPDDVHRCGDARVTHDAPSHGRGPRSRRRRRRHRGRRWATPATASGVPRSTATADPWVLTTAMAGWPPSRRSRSARPAASSVTVTRVRAGSVAGGSACGRGDRDRDRPGPMVDRDPGHGGHGQLDRQAGHRHGVDAGAGEDGRLDRVGRVQPGIAPVQPDDPLAPPHRPGQHGERVAVDGGVAVDRRPVGAARGRDGHAGARRERAGEVGHLRVGHDDGRGGEQRLGAQREQVGIARPAPTNATTPRAVPAA